MGPSESIVLVEADLLYDESDAVLLLAGILGRPWSLARVLFVFPKPLRDRVYRLVARNRYRIFGKRTACRLPTERERERFL